MHLLPHLVGRLYGRASGIVSTNLALGEWPNVFGDANHHRTARPLTYHCDIVETGNDSGQFKRRDDDQ
ncbi:DNA replication protein DnaC [Bradyrhizobium sp. LM6.10]